MWTKEKKEQNLYLIELHAAASAPPPPQDPLLTIILSLATPLKVKVSGATRGQVQCIVLN